MTAAPVTAVTATMVRSFIEVFDPSDAADQQIAARLRARLHGEIYRRERERYPECVDLGGEG